MTIYKCEACGATLTDKDFPYLYKSIGRLCVKCKRIANYIIESVSIKEIAYLAKEDK